MIMDGAFEKKIFNLWNENKKDIAKKEVFKYILKYYDKLDRVEDKIFLNYRMAFHEYIDKNIDMANVYFEKLEEIFKDEYVKKSCEYEYYRYRWLYVNNNEENLKDNYKLNEMMSIYNYYKSIQRDDLAFSALENVSKIKGNDLEILKNLENLLNEDKIQEWHLVESILNDCDKISHSLYIKAYDIVNKYKFNIDIV